MGKSQWRQWSGMDEFREHMDRLLDVASQGQHTAGMTGMGLIWVPLADVTETAEAFVARIELPGVAMERLVVEVADGALVVRGERPPECENAGMVFHVMERSHGAFARRFPLPVTAEGEGIGAVLREGVLTVTVPKRKAILPSRRVLPLD